MIAQAASTGRFHFSSAYRERLTLLDGTVVRLRLLRRDDRERLRRGFQRLSPESRMMRFFVGKAALSDEELHLFTDLRDEQIDHFALAALGSDGELLATARGISIGDRRWECGITVIDAAQGRRLGRSLLVRLLAAAHERGVRVLRFDVLRANARMLALLRRIAPRARPRDIDGIVRFDVDVGAAIGVVSSLGARR
jgi:RimJ/RimL family protein N-acetyltransferase